jgi:two-component system LytT family response regulator
MLLTKHCPSVKVLAGVMQVEEAIPLIQLHQPDLLFLDIQLGKNTGFDLLNKLEERSMEVIFVTAYDHYGIQAIKFAALDYLLKPVNPVELASAVQKAESRFRHKQQNEQLGFLLQQLNLPKTNPPRIALPQQSEIRYVLVNDIVRCEADNTYTFFFLSNGERMLISKSLKEYADLLSPHGFLRAHQSHLVNPAYVKSWLKEDGGMLLMNNGHKVPISKPNRPHVKAALGK